MLNKSYFSVSGNLFTIDVPASAIIEAGKNKEDVATWSPSFTYRVDRVVFDNGRRVQMFVNRQTDNGFVYLGVLNEQTGDVRLTNGSRIDPQMPVVRVVQRVLRAIFTDRGNAVEAAGWNVRSGMEPAPSVETQTTTETCPAKCLRGPLAFLADTFTVAVGYGLKRPMLRVHFKDRRFKFYLSKRGTVCLKTGALTYNHEDGCWDPTGDEEYAGCILRGEFRPATNREWNGAQGRTIETTRELLPVEKEFMEELAKDAVGFIAKCGKDMSRCCYCNKPLEDSRSKAVGYGPVCAKHWALPWGDEKTTEKAPSFAKNYNDDAAAMLYTIRAQNGTGEETGWLVFADWLQEHDLPRCTVPKKGTQLPRND